VESCPLIKLADDGLVYCRERILARV